MLKAIVNAKLVFPDRISEGNIVLEDDHIIAVGDVIVPKDAQVIDADGLFAGPGLVDIHCHGYANAKTGECHSAKNDPAAMARAHLRHGTTSITPSTAYSWTIDEFLTCTKECRKAMEEGNTTIEGVHFEGPFTNPKYGANAAAAWEYSDECRDRIFDAAKDIVLHCTHAPELPCGEDLEKYLTQKGIVIDIGHTELSPADAKRAIRNGARIVTHLYDAMGCWRGNDSVIETGVIQESAADVLLAERGLYYELICDARGIHVKPQNLKLAYRAAGEDWLILITDSDSVVSHHPENYPQESPKSAPDLNYNEDGELCGSRLVLSDACRNFMQHTGADLRTAFKCASYNPAKALHLDHQIGSILPGRKANIIFTDEAFHVKKIFFKGDIIL